MIKIVVKGPKSILEAGSFNKMVSHFNNKYVLETKGRVLVDWSQSSGTRQEP